MSFITCKTETISQCLPHWVIAEMNETAGHVQYFGYYFYKSHQHLYFRVWLLHLNDLESCESDL